MKYLKTIGLEVHVQLQSQTKMFCACSAEYGAPPNTSVCPVCLGYPGAMPVMNGHAIKSTVLTGLMIGSKISGYSKFDRKSYFYPDMPKNYQISQYDKPLCTGGAIEIEVDGRRKSIGVTRIHLEEDVAKSMHFQTTSGVDFNRAGVPLMEIVSEPEIESPEEAFAYLQALRHIVRYVGVSDCDLEKGNMRCDVNSSVRPIGQKQLGVKTEIKNMNTFKGVYNALKYELDRQISILESGGTVRQETLRWDADAGETVGMRTKEDAHDYRYFPEPDLMPVVISCELVEEWRRDLPELPASRKARLVSEYGVPVYDAGVLVADKPVADFFEAAARLSSSPKAVSNWVMTEMMRLLAAKDMDILDVAITPEALAGLVELTESNTINSTKAKELFVELFDNGGDPAKIVEERGWKQVSDSDVIHRFVAQALEENPKSVADYRKGKKAAAQFLVGQVMRMSRGQANPEMVRKFIEEKLN